MEIAAPVVQLSGVHKTFRSRLLWWRKGVHALSNLTMTVNRGEVYGLIGPNGSGKSTTTKLILGLLFPTGGTVRVFGEEPGTPAVNRRIGFLPEESYLYRFQTGAETLRFYGHLFGLGGELLEKRIDELLAMVGMSEARDRRLGGYSKGMQRRVGIAQALINDPEFVILDEPTSGLDVAGRLEVKDLVHRLKAMGKTILLCSHILPDVADLADRVGVLHRGVLRAEGTLGELLEQDHRHDIQVEGLHPALIGTVERVVVAGGGTVVRSAPSRDSLERVFLRIIGSGGPTIGSPEDKR